MTTEIGQIIPEGQPAPTSPAPTPQAPEAGNWYGDLGDDGLSAWAENKGFSDARTAFQSYQNLEQLLGADKAGRGVVIPKEGAADEDWGSFYDKIGRPETAEQYDLPVPDGSDGTFSKEMSTMMHKAGVPQNMAQSLAKDWNEYMVGQEAEYVQQMQSKELQEISNLEREWGGAKERNETIAKEAARSFGVEGDAVDAIQQALGYDKTMKFFYNIGNKLGEDQFLSGEGKGFDVAKTAMSPERAKLEYKNFMSDKAMVAKLSEGDAHANAVLNNIIKYKPL